MNPKLITPSILALASLALSAPPSMNAGIVHASPKRPLEMPNVLIKNATLISLETIAEESLRETQPSFLSLDAFFSDYTDEFKGHNDTLAVSLPTGFTAADVSGGYTVATNASETKKTITLNKNKGKAIGFTDGEMRKGLEYIRRRFMRPLATSIKTAILGDLLALTTDAGYTNANTVCTKASFSWDKVVDQGVLLDDAEVGPDRAFIIQPGYMGALRKDSKVAVAFAGGNPELIAKGYVGSEIAGFLPSKHSRIPTTANQVGVFFAKEALVFAVAQQYTPEDPSIECINIKDPETGVWLQFRMWYNKDAKQTVLAGEALYGCSIGVPTALNRMVSA